MATVAGLGSPRSNLQGYTNLARCHGPSLSLREMIAACKCEIYNLLSMSRRYYLTQ